VTLAGLTGLWMTWRLDAWWRFTEPGYLVDARHGGAVGDVHRDPVPGGAHVPARLV
jgi:hypothetical protein